MNPESGTGEPRRFVAYEDAKLMIAQAYRDGYYRGFLEVAVAAAMTVLVLVVLRQWVVS